MDYPHIWDTVNKYSRSDAKKSYDIFKDKIVWREDGRDSLLDIGCATGDVLKNVILPILPENFTKIKGIDISEEMINYTKLNFQNPKITFEVMDISEDPENLIIVNNYEVFDHIFSFLCLQWIPQERQSIAIQNIYNLLNVNGDCIISLLGSCVPEIHYLELMNSAKWSKYMQDAKKFISPYYFMDKPKETLEQYFNDAGFITVCVKYEKNNIFNIPLDEFRAFIPAVSPFLKRIPKEDQSDYTNDLLEIILRHYPPDSIIGPEDKLELRLPYTKFIVYAKK